MRNSFGAVVLVFAVSTSAFADLVYVPTFVDVTTSTPGAVSSGGGDRLIITSGGGSLTTTFILSFAPQEDVSGDFRLYLSGVTGSLDLAVLEFFDAAGPSGYSDARTPHVLLVDGPNSFVFSGFYGDTVAFDVIGSGSYTYESAELFVADVITPEPSTWLMYGLGLVGLGRFVWRRRKRRRLQYGFPGGLTHPHFLRYTLYITIWLTKLER